MPYSTRNVLIIFAVIATTVGLYRTHLDELAPVERVAHSVSGEHWYKIEQSGVHNGFMHSSVKLNDKNLWAFKTTTVFQSLGATPTKITEQLTFSRSPPYAMQSAGYQHNSNGTITSMRINLSENVYKGQIERNKHIKPLMLDWHFSMLDQLDLEMRLLEKKPPPGTLFTSAFIDFEELSIGRSQHLMLARKGHGFIFESQRKGSTNTTHLNGDMVAISANIAHAFRLTLSTQADATAVDPILNAVDKWRDFDQSIPLQTRLNQHENLVQLTLELTALKQSSLNQLNLPTSLSFTVPEKFSPQDAERFTRNTLRFPLTEDKVSKILATLSTPVSVADLLSTTHRQLRYADSAPTGSVLAALEHGQGECTDFADLFTTLARAAGIPARTVYGIAYLNAEQPGFMFHAWNEVYEKGKWLGVDPTWNQIRLDATHIKLSDDISAALFFASYTGNVSLKVASYTYR